MAEQTIAESPASTGSPLAADGEGRHTRHSQVDEATWRVSRVPEGAKISKTLALREYRLKPQDLDGLVFTKKRTRVAGHPHDMFLYNERGVERRAWKRHGGPEGFDIYLGKLRERHASKKGAGSSPFVQPASYSDDPGQGSGTHTRRRNRDPIPVPDKNPTHEYPNVIPPWESCDEPAVSAELAGIQQAMPSWLWDACTRALDGLYESQLVYGPLANVLYEGGRWDELTPMKAALDTLAPTYPARPPETLPSSPSVDGLRAVLACAARAPEEGVGNEYGRPVDGLADLHSYWPDPVHWYDWSAAYLERLFVAILGVVEEHGVEAGGWESVRWEVYDKYVESLRSGPKYDLESRTWSEPAAQWLDGRLAGGDLDTSCRGRCDSGREFNSRLPSTPAGQPSIGLLCRYGSVPYA